MCDEAEEGRRQALLALLERYWTNLSLKDASRLSPDSMACLADSGFFWRPDVMIKDTLTYS